VETKDYYVKNVDIIKEWVTNYREKNQEMVATYQASYRKDNEDKIRQLGKEYRLKNVDKIKAYYNDNVDTLQAKRRIYVKNRFNIDPLYKLKHNISSLIRTSFKSRNYIKKSKTTDILGCSFDEFKQHLEFLWEPWMNWDNRGLYNGECDYGWDIDHIIPLDSAITEEDIIRLNHYTNLQPLCSKVNRDIKRNFWKSGLSNKTT